jgi:3-isopropylmalate/(R)-2-methylmalate dehydratase small subunit
MEPIASLTSRTVVLPEADIDTDQIIPARFLTTTERDGLGRHAFAGWRYRPDGTPAPEFPLNRPEADGAQILVAGHNFGCGSSREHAPWALYDLGLRAVISTQIADIFRSNAQKNGLVPVVCDGDTHAWLIAHPNAEVTIDVAACELRLPDGRRVRFPLDPFARHCLLNGIDQLGYLLANDAAIRAFEAKH